MLRFWYMKYISIEIKLFLLTLLIAITGTLIMTSSFTLGTAIPVILFAVPTAFVVFIISTLLSLVRGAQNKGELQFGINRMKKLSRNEEIVLVVILVPIASTCLYILSGGYIYNSSGMTELRGLLELIILMIGGLTSLYIILYLLYSRLIAK